ncbi:MAG: primosomal protein N' [Gammaproteobacteria bacterium]|nr:primosomal protein N' [Gammaproteobacteria bacterium]MCY3988448.1 primosomal protein N' [Gammaproteobacteria bacterium]
MPSGSLLRVAVGPRFAAPLLDYLAPAGGPVPPVGARVSVPLGSGRRTGFVLEHLDGSEVPTERLRPVLDVPDAEPLWDPVTLEVLRWAANYYCHPLGQVLAYALPQQLRRGGRLPSPPLRWRAGEKASNEAPKLLARAPRQREFLDRLLEAGRNGLAEESLASLTPDWRRIVRILREKELAEPFEPGISDPAEMLREEPLALSREQSAAVSAMRMDRGFACHLLDGVTASGKTEVYLHLAEQVLAAGRQCLLLAPEIGLTPQLAERLKARFRAPAAVLHSGLNDGERTRAWADARAGRARLVVGTRSAVFVPCRELGLIVVDEEHDPSYKQQDGFRYQARDLAVMRASRSGIPVVLGSATPALESLLNVQRGRYTHPRLTKKVTGSRPPLARLVDLNRHPPEHGLSAPLLQAMSEQLESGSQVLLYLNRRGFAPLLMCPDCRRAEECSHCDARLVFYRRRDLLLCHHCGARRRPPPVCGNCGSPLQTIGRGTERLEEELQARFEDYPVARMDRDNVRGRRRLEHILGGIRERHYRILLGTQMLTKGHDFPSLGLVGVIDADQGMFSQEFRGPERLAQTLVQVAGRAGRRERPGLLVLQTRFPEHPLLRQLLKEGYGGFAATALDLRRRSGWPPYAHLALLRANAPEAASVREFLEQAIGVVPQDGSGSAVEVLGPAPALMERRRDRSHAHLLARSSSRAHLQEYLGRWIPAVRELKRPRRVSWSVDVDPAEIG